MLDSNSIEYLKTVEGLEALYGDAAPASLRKVVDRISPKYWQWISASRFCVLTTVCPAGTDGSTPGDGGPPVIALDEYTLAMPDWRGNNRLDSLRNIVEDGHIPNTVIVIKVVEIYSQYSRALMRSGLWSQTLPADLPTACDLLKEASHGDLGSPQYDSDQAKRSQNTLWSD